MVDVVAWYHEMRRETPDIYADQDWSGFHQKGRPFKDRLPNA